MNKELLEMLNEEYAKLDQETRTTLENFKELKKIKEECEENPIVQKYLEVLDEIQLLKENLKNDNNFFFNRSKITKIHDNNLSKFSIDTNKVFVRCGTVNHNSRYPSHRYYWDIESKEAIIIPLDEMAEFEKNNNIVELGAYYHDNFTTSDGGCILLYEKIREEFITDCIIEGEEKAVQNVLIRSRNICKDYNFTLNPTKKEVK